MQYKTVPYDHDLQHTLATLENPGLLLTAAKPDGSVNAMTIGWGLWGIVWGRPILQVLVRFSRYTFEFVEAGQSFGVCVPNPEMRRWVGLCGTKSGRDIDKFAAQGHSYSMAEKAPVPLIDGCPLAYVCRVVHHNDVIPANLDPEIDARVYGDHDYHRIYFGEILTTLAAE